MLNSPKNAASSSRPTVDCPTTALNCQPMTAVAQDDRRITPAMARRYGEPAINVRLCRSPELASSPSSCVPSPDSGRSTHSRSTSTPAITRHTAIPRSELSAPNRVAVYRVTKPPMIQPAVAPLPMKPNIRLASRVVRT